MKSESKSPQSGLQQERLLQEQFLQRRVLQKRLRQRPFLHSQFQGRFLETLLAEKSLVEPTPAEKLEQIAAGESLLLSQLLPSPLRQSHLLRTQTRHHLRLCSRIGFKIHAVGPPSTGLTQSSGSARNASPTASSGNRMERTGMESTLAKMAMVTLLPLSPISLILSMG